MPALLSLKDGGRPRAVSTSWIWIECARRSKGLSLPDLWSRYPALGGTRTLVDVEAILQGETDEAGHDCRLLATALDQLPAELGRRRAERARDVAWMAGPWP